MDEFKRFQMVVKNYAKAYSAFEEIQKGEKRINFVPKKGDQKTGVIGEAYIYKYLTDQGYAIVKFGNASQEAWDIQCKRNKNDKKFIKIQVKTIAYGEIISHIRPGFDILYLVKLDESFFPTKILKVTTTGDWPDIKHKKFPEKKFSYKDYKFETEDETGKLLKFLKH